MSNTGQLAFANTLGYSSEIDKLIKALAQSGRGWNMTVQEYVESGQIVKVENCFGFMFTQIGDTIARVNGMVVFPSATPNTALGDSRSCSGHLLDLYKGLINLSFQAPVGANPRIEFVQFFYVPGEYGLVNI